MTPEDINICNGITNNLGDIVLYTPNETFREECLNALDEKKPQQFKKTFAETLRNALEADNKTKKRHSKKAKKKPPTKSSTKENTTLTTYWPKIKNPTTEPILKNFEGSDL